MLKKPEVGQTVITKNPNCCGSSFPEGTIGTIAQIGPPSKELTSIIVTNKEDFWYHCPRCLRRPKKGETL